MTFFIYARDGAGMVVLRRDSEEAAQRRAAELKDMGWFDIDITEEDDAGSESALRKARPMARTSGRAGRLVDQIRKCRTPIGAMTAFDRNRLDRNSHCLPDAIGFG
jgi:hypothetical protein